MKWLWRASEFVGRIRSQMRFGERSRLPLRLVRFELRQDTAECEWFARPNDPWDVDLPVEVRTENELFQALQDALNVREALFHSLTDVRYATVKVYRRDAQVNSKLIISGNLSRDDNPPPLISSLVMRAKLYGLHFSLQDGALQPLPSETRDLTLASSRST